MVDESVSGDREHPGPEGALPFVESAPGAKGSLEGQLSQILRIETGPQSEEEEAVDVPDMMFICLDEFARNVAWGWA